MPNNQTDDDLMTAFQGGDTLAFEELFLRYHKRLFNFSLRILRHLADAEDVVSETFHMLTVKKHRYQPQGFFTAWIFTITRNLCMDKLRGRKNKMALWGLGAQEKELELESPHITPDEQAQSKDLRVHVQHAVNRLPLRYREALILREYQGLKYEEIARVLGCSIGNVKVLILRAREKLRVELLPLLKEVA